jgi:L-seryl-tRNA(Ser) seleniumtransferase
MALEFENHDSVNGRRSFMKLLAAAPLFATIGARSVAATVSNAVTSTVKRSYNDNIYTRIGVKPLINARGTWTYLCGSLEIPATRKAVEEASHYFVDMFDLQAGVGRRLAELSGAESGMITSGSAGAIAMATAGCIAGTDPNHVWQLPDTTGLKNEVVIMPRRSAFDSAIRLAGGKLVAVETVEKLQAAITPQTAMLYTDWANDDLIQGILRVTKPAGVPILVDLADRIPPFSNFTHYAKLGVDMYCFSGGKGLCGPQCAGVLLGRKDLIEAALYNSSPWEGAICRPMKVGKEEMMGMLGAIEYWAHADMDAVNKEWQSRVERIKTLVDTVSGVATNITVPTDGNSYPTLSVSWDEKTMGLTLAECEEQLRAGEPRIDVMGGSNPSGVLGRLRNTTAARRQSNRPARMQIVSMTLQPGEDLIVGNRLRQILNKARKQAS